MTFEDLSVFDLNLIKSNAVNMLVTTRISCRYEALTEAVLNCLYAKGFTLDPYPETLFRDTIKEITPVSYGFHSSVKSEPADVVIQEIFQYFNKLGISIKKDETKQPTWSTVPVQSNEKPPKKPWVF